MEIVDITIDNNGNAIKANDKIALIDADTIVYTACLRAEKTIELLPREFYTDEEWNNFLKLGEPDDQGRVYDSDIDEVMRYVIQKVDKIKLLTGCSKVKMFFTDGKASFRYLIYPEYKANRKAIHSPKYLTEAKYRACNLYDGKMLTEIEADDAVCYLARKYPNKYLLCAVDKDVLNAIEGTHFNYYESAQYNIDMKFQTTDASTARLFPYRQAMMGDKSDNIIGLDRIGPKKAAVIIGDDCKDPMKQLIEAFIHNGRTKEEAELNFKLCFMGDPEYCKGLDND